LKEAQGAILTECMHAGDVRNLLMAVAETVANAPSGDAESTLAKKALALPGSDTRIRAFVGPEALVDYVRNSYSVDKTYRPEWVLPVAARASRVTGQLLEFLSAERKWSEGPVVWVVRMTRLFWGAVEVAIPQSLSFATFRYLIWIYILAAILVVLTGALLGQSALSGAGAKMLAAGLVVVLVVQLLHEAMRGKGALWRVVRLLLIAIVVALILGGVKLTIDNAPRWLEFLRARVLG